MQAESLLAASSTQGVAQLCDPRSGALLRTLKDCRPGTNGLCASEHFVATAERDRSFVHLWSWGKEQPHFRCQAPERLTCVAATADGAHCFAGAASGKLYLWQVASGRLLLAWDAHFKAATALSLCSENFLISAGEDAIVLAWNVAQLLQAPPASCLLPHASYLLPPTSDLRSPASYLPPPTTYISYLPPPTSNLTGRRRAHHPAAGHAHLDGAHATGDLPRRTL